MKTLLLDFENEFDKSYQPYINGELLIKDLELETLFFNMSRKDSFIYKVVKQILLSNKTSLKTIYYRQNILKDCLDNSELIREFYFISKRACQNRQDYIIVFNSLNPIATLSESRQILNMFFGLLKRMKEIMEERKDKFKSDGFKRFIKMMEEDVSDDYIAEVKQTLYNLRFDEGILASVELGTGNNGENYTLIKENDENKEPWIKRIVKKEKSLSYDLNMKNRYYYRSDAESLLELREHVIRQVANTLSEVANHFERFFEQLQFEIAFYVGCINLYETITKINEIVTFPEPRDFGNFHLEFTGLYDISLALTKNTKIVSNDLNLGDKSLIIITGANQGGKSTFLRSIGITQLMMQCGMFVPAKSYSANLQGILFSHFKREEDIKMKHGKLEEELNRMNSIINHLTPDSLILFNESFSSTNEREGSEIAKQVVTALLDSHIKMFFVTHLFSFAKNLYENQDNNSMFLRAIRESDGSRTYKLIEGEPFRTSYAQDLYFSLFSKKE